MAKLLSKAVLGVAFILAGANHFWQAPLYLRIMPPYLPFPLFLVYLSGVCEAGLGAVLFVPALTRWAAWGLIALLIAVFPANLHMALHAAEFPIAPVWLWLRLPFQAVLVAWVYQHTQVEGV